MSGLFYQMLFSNKTPSSEDDTILANQNTSFDHLEGYKSNIKNIVIYMNLLMKKINSSLFHQKLNTKLFSYFSLFLAFK